MDHLVQQSVLDFRPRMALDMAPAKRNLRCLAGFAVDRELTQAPLHSAREPDRELRQCAPEMLQVELMMDLFQAMNHPEVTGPGPLPPRNPLGRWHVGMHRKIEKLPFRGPSECFWNARIQEPNDGLQDMIGSKPIPPMDSEHPSVEA